MKGIKNFPERLAVCSEQHREIKRLAIDRQEPLYEAGKAVIAMGLKHIKQVRKSIKNAERIPKGKVITSRSKIGRE